MNLLKNVLIAKKLTLIMVLASCVTILLSSAAWLSYDVANFKRELIEDSEAMCDVVALNSSASLVFDDSESLTESLNSLSAKPSVRAAYVFDSEDVVFGSFVRAGITTTPPQHKESGTILEGRSIFVYRPIALDGERIGTVCIDLDSRVIAARKRHMAKIFCGVFLASILVALLISYRLQRVISVPLLHLTDTVKEVTESRDYTVRAGKHGNDELGFLTDAFNNLLAESLRWSEELHEHQENLESEVERRTHELTDLNEELRKATLAKSEFLATMSHEIRTPMNGVLGMTELLTETSLNEDQRGYASIIRGSAETLLSIINDILDFSKIEAGALTMEDIDFDVAKTVEEVLGLLAESARRSMLDIVCWVDPKLPMLVGGDSTRVRQIVTNLVGNAIKFTGQGGVRVRVELLGATEETVRVRITVADTGIGISPKQIGRLFNSFSQADSSTTRKFGGTGLGLAISKQLVDLMDGEFAVESELGIGSRFKVTLPLRRVTGDLGAARNFDDVSESRILLLEGYGFSRRAITRQLNSWGVSHSLVLQFERAIRRLREGVREGRPFTALILDEQLLSGEEAEAFVDELLGYLADQKLKIIRVASASGEGADRGLVDRLRGSSRMLRPVRPSALLAGISPRKPAAASTKLLASSKPKQDAVPLRILVAEDNRVNQLVAERMLETDGHQVDIAENGLEALTAVQEHEYDLVFMDCQMPEMDGFDATRGIRAWEHEIGRSHDQRISIIALTANATEQDRNTCLEAGMDDFISKPIRHQVLREMVAEVAARQGARGSKLSEESRAPSIAGPIARFKREVYACSGALQAHFDAGSFDQMLGSVEQLLASAVRVEANYLLNFCIALDESLREGCGDSVSMLLGELPGVLSKCVLELEQRPDTRGTPSEEDQDDRPTAA